MSSQEEVFFLAILLYSNHKMKEVERQKLLTDIKERIRSDPVLKKHLHLVCIDNRYTKNVLQNNKRLKINRWPLFCIRRFEVVDRYEIDRYEEVFRQVKEMAARF
jgi:hypothetical protein